MEEVKFVRDKYEFTSISPIMLMNSKNQENNAELINLLLHDFSLYSILIRDLVNYPLKEKERNIALNIAFYVMENREFHEELLEHKFLNIKKLSRVVRIKPEYIKKWRDYIVAYWIILSNPDYKFIQNYLKIKVKDIVKNSQHVGDKKEKSYRGIIIKQLIHKSVYILTSSGEFKKVRLSEPQIIGDICEGKREFSKYIYKIPISILILISIIIGFNAYSKYTTTRSIIVIETTSNIKLHANAYGRIIYAYSPTDKGKELTAKIDMQNKKIDDAICEIIEYGYKNKMISHENTVYITVTGINLTYGELVKTSKYISDNNKKNEDNKISVIINNGGVEQKLLSEEKKPKSSQKNTDKNNAEK